ncbi:MAG: hypothetical protein IAF38_00580 [Bacteroidia bacterium]|nr:hypothetical protein [Bacteroidia bacterium]
MKKSLVFFLFGFVFCFAMSAQTKRIFHRAHSGSDKKFSIASAGNFGWVPLVLPENDTNVKEPVKKLQVIKSDSAGTSATKESKGKGKETPLVKKNRKIKGSQKQK